MRLPIPILLTTAVLAGMYWLPAGAAQWSRALLHGDGALGDYCRSHPQRCHHAEKELQQACREYPQRCQQVQQHVEERRQACQKDPQECERLRQRAEAQCRRNPHLEICAQLNPQTSTSGAESPDRSPPH